jgi:hypothetical protein
LRDLFRIEGVQAELIQPFPAEVGVIPCIPESPPLVIRKRKAPRLQPILRGAALVGITAGQVVNLSADEVAMLAAPEYAAIDALLYLNPVHERAGKHDEIGRDIHVGLEAGFR